MKARDIIPGWPKGRSTSTFIPRSADAEWMRWRIEAGCTILSSRNASYRLAEVIAGVQYHEAQQRMMNDFFAHWRTAEPGELFGVPVRMVGAGELGRCFGFSIPD